MDALGEIGYDAGLLEGLKFTPYNDRAGDAVPLRTTHISVILSSPFYLASHPNGVRFPPSPGQLNLFRKFYLDFALNPYMWATAVFRHMGAYPAYIRFAAIGFPEIGPNRGRIHAHFNVVIGHRFYYTPPPPYLPQARTVSGDMSRNGTFISGINIKALADIIRGAGVQGEWATAAGHAELGDSSRWVLAMRVASDLDNYNRKERVAAHFAWLFSRGALRHTTKTAGQVLAGYATRGTHPMAPDPRAPFVVRPATPIRGGMYPNENLSAA